MKSTEMKGRTVEGKNGTIGEWRKKGKWEGEGKKGRVGEAGRGGR